MTFLHTILNQVFVRYTVQQAIAKVILINFNTIKVKLGSSKYILTATVPATSTVKLWQRSLEWYYIKFGGKRALNIIALSCIRLVCWV